MIRTFIPEDCFIACERGFRQAEKELGNVKVDLHTYADTLRNAMAKGNKVISRDADVEPTGRNFFVNQAESGKIAIRGYPEANHGMSHFLQK